MRRCVRPCFQSSTFRANVSVDRRLPDCPNLLPRCRARRCDGPIRNATDLAGAIAVVERDPPQKLVNRMGFVAKARIVQQHGGATAEPLHSGHARCGFSCTARSIRALTLRVVRCPQQAASDAFTTALIVGWHGCGKHGRRLDAPIRRRVHGRHIHPDGDCAAEGCLLSTQRHWHMRVHPVFPSTAHALLLIAS
jgi:hypothetical protein